MRRIAGIGFLAIFLMALAGPGVHAAKDDSGSEGLHAGKYLRKKASKKQSKSGEPALQSIKEKIRPAQEGPSGGPDAVAVSVKVDGMDKNNQVPVGHKAKVRFDYANEGMQDIERMRVVLLADGRPMDLDNMAQVKAGGAGFLETEHVFEEAGMSTITGIVDAKNSVEETRENNNRTDLKVEVVEPAPVTDAVALSVEVEGAGKKNTVPLGHEGEVRFAYECQGSEGIRKMRVALKQDGKAIDFDNKVSLAAGKKGELSKEVKFDRSGTVTFEGVVDGKNQVPEIREDNNSAKTAVKVLEPVPTRDAVALSLEVEGADRSNAIPLGHTGQVRFNYGNVGRDDIERMRVVIREDAQVFSFDNAAAAGAGRTNTLARRHTFDRPGPVQFVGIVDESSQVHESNESNNRTELTVHVASDSDLEIPQIIVQGRADGDPVRAGEQLTVLMYAANRGHEELTGIPFELKAGDEVLAAGRIDRIEAGRSVVRGGRYTFAEPGEVTFTGILDEENIIPEHNENNNRKEWTVTVSPANLDLRADRIEIDGIGADGQIPLDFEGVIRPRFSKAGDGSAARVYHEIFIGNERLARVVSDDFANRSDSAGFYRHIFSQAGEHVLAAVIDADQTVREADETNNRVERRVTVSETRADLEAGHIEIEGYGQGNRVPAGHEGEIRFHMVNSGQVRLESAGYAIFVNGRRLVRSDAGALDPGQTAIGRAPFTFGEGPQYFIEAVADPQEEIGEAREANNRIEKTIDVTPVNLEVRASQIIVDGLEPWRSEAGREPLYEGDRRQITLYAQNDGDSDLYDIQAEIKVNGQTILDETIPHLAVGEGRVRARSHTFPSAGRYTITGILDGPDRIREGNENDNRQEITVEALSSNKDLRADRIEIVGVDPAGNVPYLHRAEVRIHVTNTGDTVVEAADYSLTMNGRPYGGGWFRDLQPGASAWTGFTYTFSPAGPCTIEAVVDAGERVVETDENNNRLERTLTVEAPA